MLTRHSHRSRKAASQKRRRTHGQLTHKRKALFEQLEDEGPWARTGQLFGVFGRRTCRDESRVGDWCCRF